jgi:hypothetical protein
MALRPLKGQPGKFLDTSSGKILDISEFREDDKYDTVIIPPGAISAGNEFIFFRDIQGKRPIDTNFTQTSRLSAGEEMVVERVGATMRLATGNLIPVPADYKRISDDAHLRVTVNQLLLIEGPLVKFPSGYGLSGQTQETDAGIVSIGVPSTAAASKLIKTQMLTNKHEVEGNMTFFNRSWAAPVFAAAVPPIPLENLMPTIETPIFVTLWLHGLVKAAVSK